MKFINITKEEIQMANKLKIHLLSLITKDIIIPKWNQQRFGMISFEIGILIQQFGAIINLFSWEISWATQIGSLQKKFLPLRFSIPLQEIYFQWNDLRVQR